VFGAGSGDGTAPPAVDVKSLHARIGELTLENDFLERAHQGGIAERKAMIDREHDLPITRQAAVLNISRGSVYYRPRPMPETDLAIMRPVMTARCQGRVLRCPLQDQPRPVVRSRVPGEQKRPETCGRADQEQDQGLPLRSGPRRYQRCRISDRKRQARPSPWYGVSTSDVTSGQFATARWVFATFCAVAVAVAGSIAALVYYARSRVPGAPSLLGTLMIGLAHGSNWACAASGLARIRGADCLAPDIGMPLPPVSMARSDATAHRYSKHLGQLERASIKRWPAPHLEHSSIYLVRSAV
jgi:hypothetical protein